jgi:hypothetical protein
LSENRLGILEAWRPFLEIFILSLEQAHIRLMEGLDELVWVYNVSGCFYSAQQGCLEIILGQDPEKEWCWRKLWKIKSLPKRLL